MLKSGNRGQVRWRYRGTVNGYRCLKCLALAVTSDGNINQFRDGDNGDLSVQDDAENGFSN